MEMCYDGALVMPSSYVVMDEEEMIYVEGGYSVAVNALIVATIAVMSIGLISAISTGAIAVVLTSFGTVMKCGVMKSLVLALGKETAIGVVLSVVGTTASVVTAIVGKYA